ncbi:hypothetical protein BGZ49_002382 [Haplosporangium sp. Z 27]|nr:hypothetical protein BGZ49_002382 [Haplosporangium sp. Z 27]
MLILISMKQFCYKQSFVDTFYKNNFVNENIVVLIDEFDILFDASDKIRDDCLSLFRGIRQNNDLYSIDSIVVYGTFGLQYLRTRNIRVSPFNFNETIKNPYFTFEQTKRLSDEYATDEMITIDDRTVLDVFQKSNGHPGMVCLCGWSIHENLLSKVNKSTGCLDYGFLGDVAIEDSNQRMLADFLTAEGVLLNGDGNKYHMAYAFIESFKRLNVIPRRYPGAPPTSFLRKYDGGLLDILETLKVAL